MLLILSEADDGHVPMVVPKLEARGASYLWFSVSTFPREAQIAVEYAPNGLMSRTLWCKGHAYDLSSVTAVWHRREGVMQAGDSVTEPSQRAYVEKVSSNFLDGLFAIVGGRWLPALPSVDLAANNKLYHSTVAGRLGFKLPATLITNSPPAFIDFWNRSAVPMVSKSATYREFTRDGDPYMLYTHLLSRRHAANAHLVRYSPLIFQHYVPKRVELRVTVVGNRVFCAEIDSQQSRSTRHDWRHYDDPNVQYRVHRMPAEVEARCVQLVETLGLAYGAIDLIVTPDGDYVFLEINANGQWGWVEEMTELPIAAAIADWLIDGGGAQGRPHG
jgi:hypothetical protein